ncbi:MAG: DUF429 domain-containing protein [Planctomycetota bacterium]
MRAAGPVPLAWRRADATAQTAAIEVYPAGTLRADGLDVGGYARGRNAPTLRRRVAEHIGRYLDLGAFRTDLLENEHVLDAAVCVLAAIDFLTGRCIVPPDDPRIRVEGWIWVRRPDSPPASYRSLYG